MEETGGNGENHRPVASHWQTLSHNVVHDHDHGHDDPYSNRIRRFGIILLTRSTSFHGKNKGDNEEMILLNKNVDTNCIIHKAFLE